MWGGGRWGGMDGAGPGTVATGSQGNSFRPERTLIVLWRENSDGSERQPHPAWQ